MLRIHAATSAEAVKKYFSSSDYYSEGQETIGTWGGRLAETIGLRGAVDKRSFDLLCDNINPATGEPLTPRTNDNRRVGYDFVFDGPKSFSAMAAMAPDGLRQRLRQLFDESVLETVREDIEPDMHTRVRRDGTREDRRTGNILYSWFPHSTSRPVPGFVPDMQWHDHVFVFNATIDEEEDAIKAGEFSYIKRDGEYYNAVFSARLARKLEGLGIGIDRRGGKEWEIAHVPQSVIDKFSKRTAEIEAEHERRLKNDPDYRPGNKHELGARTRKGKQNELSPDDLRKAWDAQLTVPERDALRDIHAHGSTGSAPVSAREAVDFALAHCFTKESLVPERQVVATALHAGLGHVTAEEIRREMDRQGVLTGEIDGRMMATTRKVRREENQIVRIATNGIGSIGEVGVDPRLGRGILDDEQWDAVNNLLNSWDFVTVVDSAAGTGKSTMLKAYGEGLRLAGAGATWLGTTSTSVNVLREDGLPAETVARFLVDEKMQESARGGRIVVDEGSMLGHEDAHRLFQIADRLDAPLVIVGDSRQHGSVARGALMRVLSEHAHLEPIRLTAIKRQKDADYLAAVHKAYEGNPVGAFDRLSAKGWVVGMVNDDDRCRHIAADYVQAQFDLQSLPEKDRVLVVAPTHVEGERITAEIRGQLRQANMLGDRDRRFTRLVQVDASKAELGLATTYRAGDMIQYHQNAKGVTRGQRLTVTDPAAVPLEHAGKFSLYRPREISLAEGDVVRFTGTVTSRDRKHKLRNGDVHKVAEITNSGDIRLENGWLLDGDCGHLRHGYVETSMGSQGRTVSRVILGMSSESLPAINMEQWYVSASRARDRLRLYTDDVDEVRDTIRRSSQKKVALDLVGPDRAPETSRREGWMRAMQEDSHRRYWTRRRRELTPDRPTPTVPQPSGPGRSEPSTRVTVYGDTRERNQGHAR